MSEDGQRLELTNGLVRRSFVLAPNLATIALDNLTTQQSILRAVGPEARLVIDGIAYDVGGLKGQPNHAFLTDAWLDDLQNDPQALQYVGYSIEKPQERIRWKKVRYHADVAWPPPGVMVKFRFRFPDNIRSNELNSEAERNLRSNDNFREVAVNVCYEMYDGIPGYGKWIEIDNGSANSIHLDKFTSDLLAAVEFASEVDTLSSAGNTPPNLHVETDMAFGGMMASGANRHSYRWLPDPEFHTQVNYEKQTPCLLEVGPDIGPDVDIPAGQSFATFRSWVLPHDSTERERKGLTIRRFYRTMAPWVTENPLMMHLIASDEASVHRAIDQCAEVGFEMLIMSFGSGFNVEDRRPENLTKAKSFADYARSKGIEIGSYSLLASRRISDEHDVVMPEGMKPIFGNSPCLGSRWGVSYFEQIDRFYRHSGFTLLEHDGSYPGDVCASELHPGHRHLADSKWRQWEKISNFYQWCRGEGIFLNVPDHYFLAGSNKTGMGYREVNWSLPRAEQVIHTRQNIYDGTWEKLPSMGWMFVPLTQYHGGGAAATFEPLSEHLDHYARMLDSNLALGVQACYRGPRLYDTEATKNMVISKVAWYKKYRTILEGDLIHGRRADARDIDWMLHVDPASQRCGMLVVFNPKTEPVQRALRVPSYYTGLTQNAIVTDSEGNKSDLRLERDYSVQLDIDVPAEGMSWYLFERP